jgi:hypothetical protein
MQADTDKGSFANGNMFRAHGFVDGSENGVYSQIAI